jgi:hypothetical protein
MRLAPAALAALCLVALAPRAHAVTVHFVVAEFGTPNNGDSYVLPLSDPDDIAHARALIEQGPAALPFIAVAAIAAGSDGINRDVLAPGEPLWSWHVTAFEGFFDATAEILDGWPGLVEQDVAEWINATNGFVGFWQYTVVAELPAVAEASALPSLGAALAALLGLRATRAPLTRHSRAQ